MAVKVAKAQSNEARRELIIHQHLASFEEIPKLTRLLDGFYHQGPSGVHPCLVLEAMDPSVACMDLHLTEMQIGTSPLTGRETYEITHNFSLPVAMSIVKQTLLGIQALHRRGIVHTDLHLGNISCPHPKAWRMRSSRVSLRMARSSRKGSRV